MKGTTNATQQTLFGEILNLRLVTNQSSHEDLIGATVKINSQTYTWYGQDITVEIPAMMTYTIEASEVEGYRTPEIQIINSYIGNVNNMTLSYDCELVTINVSDSDGNTLDSSNVTINEMVGNKVPYGETYTVVANAIDGYITPLSQTYTASQPTREISMEYKAGYFGVFIATQAGDLINPNNWTSSSGTAVGIAVCTENSKYIIGLSSQQIDTIRWSTSSTNTDKPNVPTSTSESEIITYYDGESYTIGMGRSTADASGQMYVQTIQFGNERLNGYLGSAGEWNDAINNYQAISDAFAKIGDFLVSDSSIDFWTSCEYNGGQAWNVYLNSYNGNGFEYSYKTAYLSAVPFYKI